MVLLPPVVSIVLSRCRSREQIPEVLRDLRDELAASRARVWAAIRRARMAESVKDGFEAISELEEVARSFIAAPDEPRFASIRVFWEMVIGAAAGGAAAGHPVGAIVGGAALPLATEIATRLSTKLLSRGSIDLGRRLGLELLRVKPEVALKMLSRHLTAGERAKLGL
jgi:hypothetical protein